MFRLKPLLIALCLLAGMQAGAAVEAQAGTLTYTRMESSTAAGSDVAVVALPEAARGATATTPNTYNVFVTQSPANKTWTAQVSMVNALTNAATGATLANADVYVETAAASYASLSAIRTVNGTLPAVSPSSSGAFHFQLRPQVAETSGTFTGTIRITVTPNGGTAVTRDYSITGAVTAAMTFSRIEVAAAAGVPVTSLSLPETTAGVASSASANYRVVATSSSKWQVSAQITSAFTAGGGAVLPNSGIFVKGAAQGAFTSFASGIPSASIVLETAVLQTATTSSNFAFQSLPPAGQDSGAYVGTITITATTL
ncbi:MAG: hypothetical protein JWN41_1671 [Thermoleophilia bacterium]|nr:hypothetical protein [Thermoleophilia bacterium]